KSYEFSLDQGGKQNVGTNSCSRISGGGAGMSGRCTRRLSDRRDRRDDRSGGGHERAADRRLASLHGPSQRSRRGQRKENLTDRARRSKRTHPSHRQPPT